MKKTFRLIGLFVCIFGISSFALSEENTLSVGYAELDITPPLGVTMPGYFTIRHATGVLDPLMVKTLVLSQGETTLAIAAFDLIGIDAEIVKEIRGKIERETGIPTDRIFIHGTHTHTGATVSEIKEGLPRQAASAVKKAMENRVSENLVTLGTGQEKTIAFIRRYLMKDGTVATNPGYANPNVARPIGAIDPTVYVVTFTGARTMLVSYGVHPDCIGGEKFSADYPYHITQTIKEALGSDWNVIYLNACCGNVNHINVNDPNPIGGYENSRHIGRTLGQAALAAHRNARPIAIDQLAGKTTVVPSPARSVPQELIDWARQQTNANPDEARKRKFNEETPSEIMARAEAQGKEIPAEIIALRIGPLAIVGFPAEIFKEVAADVKAHSLLDPTLVIGVTGGDYGYLPHPRGYDEGGYEATYGSAPFAPNTSILWSDAATRMIREFVQPAQ